MITKVFRLATAALLLGTTLLATSCDKSSEDIEKPVVKPELNGVEFSVKPMELKEWKSFWPSSGHITRATALSETEREIHFTAGDMLYVEGIQYDMAHNVMSTCLGNLTMESGAGEKEATFSGELYAPEGTTTDDFSDIIYYLIGANDKRAMLIDVEGVEVKAVARPLAENHIVSSFSEAIEKYSEIGFLAPKFTNEVKLQQSNAYFVFNISFADPSTFDNVADIKATFVRPDGSTLVVTTEEKPTGFKLDEKGILKVVVPCAIEDEKEQFTDIKLAVNIQNGKSFVQSFPSESVAGNTVEHGEVYVLNCSSDYSVTLDPMHQEDWYSALYTVSVSGPQGTRATVHDWDPTNLFFEEGDILYIEGQKTEDSYDDMCIGHLTMVSTSSDKTSATFSGNILMPAGETLASYKYVTYSLIGKDNALYTFTKKTINGQSVEEMNEEFNETRIVPTLSEAVRKYSDIGYYSSTGFSDQITLKQNNTFFDVILNLPVNDITIDGLKSVKATLAYVSEEGADEIATDYTPVLDEYGSAHFVVPVINDDNLTIKNIRFDVTLSDDRVLKLNIEKLKKMEKGYVYNINKDVVSVLTDESRVGDIGIVDGIKGIVVDLGENGGKIAIALTNYGKDPENWQDQGLRTSFDYITANMPRGWVLPEITVFEDLFSLYKNNLEYVGTGYEGEILWYAVFTFDGGRTLELRAETEKDISGFKYAYWSATQDTAFERMSRYYMLAFEQSAENEILLKTNYNLQRDESYGYVRLIHYLQ